MGLVKESAILSVIFARSKDWWFGLPVCILMDFRPYDCTKAE
jgi:hypothetical protein